ncbi:glycosyltransferase family 2 protein [Coprococcus catus]|uniref:glycosyltransferase family 2 protein n=1 Tax=Coprococcus catus TaxID=116085 RepID=UPI001C8BDA4D|nr:glycosyltransferase [Coprococcus catus]MBX9229548.1 glycosyltransferase [Coprococcus catus]MCT6800977.1 glycosyltransferase [Coprococcus catus]
MGTKTQPLISVIMGVYNPSDYNQLEEAVNSILNQTFKDFEFIIYDDGNDEVTAKVIERIKQKDSRIRVIREKDNKGLGFALNQCIHVARGKYLARMDADDISFPERLEEEMKFLEQHCEYDWVGCNAVIVSDYTIMGVRRMAEIPNQYNFLPFSPFIHPSVMFRRELFEKDNKYNIDEKTLRCEDYELFMRLYQQGYRGYNIQKCLFMYREGSDSYQKRTLKSRCNEMKIRKNNFSKMSLPLVSRGIYILRPLFTICIPRNVILLYKKMRLRSLNPLTYEENRAYIRVFHDVIREKNVNGWDKGKEATSLVRETTESKFDAIR